MKTSDNFFENIMPAEAIGPYLDLSYDVVFKRVFGKPSNKDLLIALLNAVLENVCVEDLEYIGTEFTGFDYNSKNSRMDLRCRLDTGEEVIIEVQMKDQHDFGDRALYYAALPILEEVESGQASYRLTPRYIVAFLHFKLDHSTNTHWNDEYRSFYAMREKYTGEKLSEAMNIVFVELGRFKKDINSLENDIERFYFCLKHMGQMKSRPCQLDGKLMERLFDVTLVESLSKKEKNQYIRYMTTERDIRNQNAFEREKAMQEGMTKGRELTARNLKGLGIATETIVKATGLTVEEITAL